MAKFASFAGLVNELKRDLNERFKQGLPKAAATALTRTAIAVRKDLQQDMKKRFDRPAPFTLNSLLVVPATARTLTATIRTKEFGGTPAANFLSPEIEGGARHLKRFEKSLRIKGILPPGKYCAPGKAAKLDRYGNQSTGEIVQILSQLQAFSEVGYNANETVSSRRRRIKLAAIAQRARGKFFVAKSKITGQPLGIYKVLSKGHVGQVVAFVSRPAYVERFPFWQLAVSHAERHFEEQMFQALKEQAERHKVVS